MEQEATYVGIDVAKAQVDVAVRPTDDSWGVPHDQKGVRKLVSQMKALKPAMVLLEASGGLELSLVAALAAAALPVVVVNPRQVRDFARATGKLAKTDSLDAAVLAHFAEAVRPPVRPLRDAETQALNSLAARRHQVMTMLVSEKNRLSAATVAASRLTSRGWNRSWTTWTRVCGRPSIRVPCGGEGRPPAHRPRNGKAGLPHPLGLPAGAGHPGPPADRRPGGGGLSTTGTAAPCGAGAPSGADAHGSAPLCTWERWWPAASTPSYGTSTGGCWPPVQPKKLALTACMRKLLVILNSMLKHRSPWCDLTPQVVAHSS